MAGRIGGTYGRRPELVCLMPFDVPIGLFGRHRTAKPARTNYWKL
jgi:hypothetical protein